MICPYCGTSIHLNISNTALFENNETVKNNRNEGYEINGGFCPECDKLILFMERIYFSFTEHGYMCNQRVSDSKKRIYPLHKKFINLSNKIPNNYKNKLNETKQVLEISPKASAALSRRLLQDILHNECNIKERNLYTEIDVFINKPDTPSLLAKSLDIIRNIGNFAAHPIKNNHSGEIVEVETSEAELLLEILDLLFDYVFIKPKEINEKKKIINEKLIKFGKNPINEN